ncbi:MAG: FHA domain-containing protein, partial [Planctomycetes bacterium]|nr:FHA domain-containing protein [Planctomycetota bacterium]
MPKIIVSDADGEREYGLTKDEIGIGRVSGQNDIVIKVSEASRRHCRVVKEDDAWFVEDLGSSNGTRVNGRKVTKFELQDGDEIQVGIARMRFLSSDVEDAPPISGSSDEIELEISLDDDACWLAFTNGPRAGERIPLQGRCTIGRRSTNTLVLEEKGVSGSHTEVHPENGGWRVRDAGSTNGTLVNGEKIVEADLEPGDIIKVGIVEFLFGTGDEVDLSAISATTQLETTGLDEEVFAISDRNFKRRRKTSLVLSLGLVAAIVGSAAWWITQGGSQSATRREPERISGNVIVKGASFELDQIGEDDYLTSDSDALDYQEVSKPVNSGVNALEVRAAGVEGSAYVEFLQPIENVNSADRFEIGAHLRASGLQGNAGVSLLWAAEDGRPLGTSDLIANPGGSGFQRLSGFVRPPEGAARARFGIGFHDANGKLYVDDVFL